MSFITIKFQEIMLSVSVELGWRTVLISIFNFGQISKLKRGHYSQNINRIRISCGYAHLYDMSFITTKFLEILLSSFRGIALTNCFSNIFHFGQISNFKKGVIPRKKNEINFLWICISSHELCPSQLQRFTKFYWAVSEELCWQTVSEVSFILVKFLISKRM